MSAAACPDDHCDGCVAGTPAQTEDMFVGHVELTATERSYVQGMIAETYMGGHPTPPGIDRRAFAQTLARKLLGPLCLVQKPEEASHGPPSQVSADHP